ncbi:hypothetical protein AX774_g4390 [Zancudomyces culisetae]|uniref:Uncharacterized protein n=1 Tax=Zancudomyces culisetae TaxID=1213189 RepID=A0A1R1PMH5_ZANCU|nr:hypothetical protein AX774_g4390 [Zancudomyces culisetae]|eukprot:OMH82139.1 hypothetical protein AX774_g4390 [Zancudomyces culisetae]
MSLDFFNSFLVLELPPLIVLGMYLYFEYQKCLIQLELQKTELKLKLLEINLKYKGNDNGTGALEKNLLDDFDPNGQKLDKEGSMNV